MLNFSAMQATPSQDESQTENHPAPFFRGFRLVAALVVLSVTLPAQILIQEIHVEGNRRLKEPAVIAASGLHLKTQVSTADLDAAMQRLFETGLFTGLNYRYAAAKQAASVGQSVTLIVTEDAARAKVVIDIPGTDPEEDLGATHRRFQSAR